MRQPADALLAFRQMIKYYDLCLEEVRTRHDLSRLEIKIISFLKNNPGKDTVREIAEARMLSKGNVSAAADALIQKGLLLRRQDQQDRRWVHLELRPAAAPIAAEIEAAGEHFVAQAFLGFSPEDWQRYQDLNERLAHNIATAFERGTSDHHEH